MKNLFKKSNSSSGDLTPRKKQSKNSSDLTTSTPPVTPSPTKEESNISVRVIPSKNQKETTQTESQDLSISDHYDSTLFAAVLGMGCGTPLWDSSSSILLNGIGTSLTTIPEETSETRKEWGTPPSFDDSEDSVNHDDFEVVLEKDNDKRFDQLGSNFFNHTDFPPFCLPCDFADSQRSQGVGSNDAEEKKKRKFKLPKFTNKKGKMSRDAASAENLTQESESKRSGDASPRSSSLSKSELPKRRILSNSSRSLRKVQIGKMFHARFHKRRSTQIKNRGASISDQKITASDSIEHQQQSPRRKKSKHGRWKCVHDTDTNRFYYYHTKTRQVTWKRPDDFFEWRVTTDPNHGQYFYNVFTKETSWDMPSGFKQWREVKDEKSGKSYYYNVLTKESTWIKPTNIKNDVQEPTTNVTEKSHEVKNRSIAVENEPIKVNWEEDPISHDIIESVEENGDDSCLDQLPESASVDFDTEDQPESHTQPAIPSDEPPKITITDEHTKLSRLLSIYCPDEQENNTLLLEKCRGQETPIIKAIEGLLEETPFDELRLAIFSFVKSTLKEMGEQPFDERRMGRHKPSCPPVTQLSPKRLRRVNTTVSNTVSLAAYSMGSRVYSHATGRSATTNVTDQTNRINNTTNRMSSGNVSEKDMMDLAAMNKRWQDMNLNQSFEELTDVTDDEGSKQFVLDMELMETKNDFRVRKVGGVESSGMEKVASCVEDSEMKVDMHMQQSMANGISLPHADCSSNISHHSETIESAYAADNDEETDSQRSEGGPDDDVSALSDSFSPSMTKRYMKEKRIVTAKEESLRMIKAKSIVKKYAQDEKGLLYPGELKLDKTIGGNIIGDTPPKHQYVSLNSHRKDSSDGAEFSSVGYEELPRDKVVNGFSRARSDGHSLSSWDDDTVTTNTSA